MRYRELPTPCCLALANTLLPSPCRTAATRAAHILLPRILLNGQPHHHHHPHLTQSVMSPAALAFAHAKSASKWPRKGEEIRRATRKETAGTVGAGTRAVPGRKQSGTNRPHRRAHRQLGVQASATSGTMTTDGVLHDGAIPVAAVAAEVAAVTASIAGAGEGGSCRG